MPGMTRMTPGVTTGLNAGINTASQSTTNNFRINGGRGNTSELLIDGAANDKIGDAAGAFSYLTVDASQEFKVGRIRPNLRRRPTG